MPIGEICKYISFNSDNELVASQSMPLYLKEEFEALKQYYHNKKSKQMF